MSYPCVKFHGLDCIGCGRCDRYSDDDGFDDVDVDSISEEDLTDGEEYDENDYT